MSVSLVEETAVLGGNLRPTESNWQTFTHTACARSQYHLSWAVAV